MMKEAKQVIVVRTDIFSDKDSNGKMSLNPKLMGKMGIQMSHAAKAVILNQVKSGEWVINNDECMTKGMENDLESDPVHQWCQGAFVGVAVKVKSEEKLRNIYESAHEAGLPCSFIVDAGRTVFEGIPTPTCVGIGPADPEEIDKITGKLRLL
jgi:peptidyl-tRNA hydrolase